MSDTQTLPDIALVVDAVLDARIHPHDLPAPLHDLWRDGFTAGQNAARARVARAEADADRYYYEAYNSDEAKAKHRELLAAFDLAQHRKITAEKLAELDRIAAQRAAEATL